MKVCKRCGHDKELSEFYPAKDCHQGVRPECKQCARDASAAAYRRNPEPYKARSAAYKREHPERPRQWQRAYRERRRAGQRPGVEPTEEDRRRWAHLSQDEQRIAAYLWRRWGMTDEQMRAYWDGLTTEQRATARRNALKLHAREAKHQPQPPPGAEVEAQPESDASA